MKELTEETWELLEKKVSNKFPLLIFHSILSESQIKDQELPVVDSKNYIYTFYHRRYFDNIVAVGQKFDRLFWSKAPEQNIGVQAQIDFVTLKKGDHIFFIPSGYGGISRVHFSKGVPKEIDKVPFDDVEGKFDWNKYDLLYLTTKEIMDNLIEILKED